MRKLRNFKSRIMSATMAATLAAVGVLAFIPPMEVEAAGKASGNALKAIGINSDVEPLMIMYGGRKYNKTCPLFI